MRVVTATHVITVFLTIAAAVPAAYAAGPEPVITSTSSNVRLSFGPAATADAGSRAVFAGVTFLEPDSHSAGFPAAPLVGLDAGIAVPVTAVAAQAPAPVAVDYSDAYHVRAKVHRIASFATIPLFATEAFVGESLYNSPSSGKKQAHLVLAGAIGGLFAVNTVTGVWNLMDARHDPNGRKRRWTHGLLMLAADAAFLGTAMTAPSSEGHEGRFRMTQNNGSSKSTHRAMAFSAMTLATSGYVVMLFGGR